MAKIEFINVSLKNFMSFGNAEITFDYKKGINVVTGKVDNNGSRNGCGKSVLVVDSLSFALYGKVLRGGKVILAELVNKINKKDCKVTAIFKVDEDYLKVERTIKPNDLKIYVGPDLENLELKKFDANGRNQEWLEKKIGVNHTCFNNIIVLNVNSSVPFLDMEAAKKREVIENILSSAIYGRMAKISNERYLDLKTEVKACDVSYQATLRHLESSKNTLSKHQEVIDRLTKEKENNIKKLKDEIEALTSKSNSIKSSIKDINHDEEKSKIEKEIREKESLINDLRSTIKIAQNEISKAKEALSHIEDVPHCPTCHTPSDNPYIQKYISDLKEIVSKQDTIINDAKQKGSKTVKEKETLEASLNTIKIDIQTQNRLKEELRINNNNILHKNNELSKEETRVIEYGGVSLEEVTKLEQKAKEEQEKLDKANSEFQHYNVIKQILSEDGLRKFVVSRILPILNSKVNEYLKIMGSEYTLSFNMGLEEKILSRNREERPYNSFSSGEKKRLDISVLLALMDISRMQNSVETNLLVLDEVLDTSMDSDGVENFLEFLKTGFKKSYPDKCIYIITHRKEISGETFDRLINLVKKDNFTQIESIIDMTHPQSV